MVFYGWVILGAAMLMDLCTAPAHSTGLNIFFDDLMTATNTPRASMSLTYSIALCTSAALTPLVGWLVDILGPRQVAVVAVTITGAALIGLAGVTGQLELGVWFAMLRFGGPECMSICGTTAVMRWFVKRRGLVSSIRTVGGMVVYMFPALIGPTLDRLGWRGTFRMLGLVTFAVGGAAALLIKTSPEEEGVLPDGEMPPPGKPLRDSEANGDDDAGAARATADPQVGEPDFTFEEVARQRFLWYYMTCSMAYDLFWAGGWTQCHNMSGASFLLYHARGTVG